MSLGMLVLIVLLLMLGGVVPAWRYRRADGWGPTGGLGLALVFVLALVLAGVV
jgi:hypothetical protein